MGLRFDARVAGIIGLVMLLLCAFPFINPFRIIRPAVSGIFFPVVLYCCYCCTWLTTTIDYLHQRFNASVLNCYRMVFPLPWCGRPTRCCNRWLPWSSAAIARWFWLAAGSGFIWRQHRQTCRCYLLCCGFLIMAQATVGKIVLLKPGQFPLRWTMPLPWWWFLKHSWRWTRCRVCKHSATNSTLISKSKDILPADGSTAGYCGRTTVCNWITGGIIQFRRPISSSPNIVLVICESFSAYKSSMPVANNTAVVLMERLYKEQVSV